MWLALKLYASNVWSFLLPIIKIFLSKIGPVLANAAMAAVTTLATTDMSNPEKQSAAFDMIVKDLTKQGISIGVSTINLAIEAAVQNLKDKTQ